MIHFENRREAGKRLASKLSAYKNCADAIVLGIPRGGVIVADEIARALNLALDIFITRKIGAPFNHELALGAIASDGTVYLDQQLIREFGLSQHSIENACEAQKREIERRAAMYRRDRPPLNLENKIAILVDDGVATGATTLAALRALRHQNPSRLILAVPVAPKQMVQPLRAACDELVLLAAPEPFIAVGYFYEDFEQVTDEQVVGILQANP